MIALDDLRVALPLPRRFDVDRLLEDLAALRRFPRTQLAASYGRGRWGGVSLYGVSGRMESLACVDEPYWPTEALAACPYLQEVLASFDAQKRSVRVLCLAPGARVFEHYDPDSSLDRDTVRLHVPIVTHPDVDFFIAGRRVRMMPGELWYGDFAFPHRLQNRSPVERVHLVMDMEITDAIGRLFPPGYARGVALRRIHRASRCWLSDRKAGVMGLLARTLG
jgi:hypothetical protein